MTGFFIEDRFYGDLREYLMDADLGKEEIEKLPDDYVLEVGDCDLEPMFQLDAAMLSGVLHNNYEERYSEEAPEFDAITKALSECVDFKKLNDMIPSLYFLNGKDRKLTKEDLLKEITAL